MDWAFDPNSLDDNDTCYVVRSTMGWRDHNGMYRLDWPAHSPDLNPIKNLWDDLDSPGKRSLQQPFEIGERTCMSLPNLVEKSTAVHNSNTCAKHGLQD
ncbi:hypothetical protein TNCV_2282171 [Trichonephila clavipes]|nr:hypothetical protein TNCV_2282171 [Trichonephila clavipes]